MTFITWFIWFICWVAFSFVNAYLSFLKLEPEQREEALYLRKLTKRKLWIASKKPKHPKQTLEFTKEAVEAMMKIDYSKRLKKK